VLAVFEEAADRRAIEIAPVVEAAMVDEHFGAHDIEKRLPELELDVGRGRVDQLGAEAPAGGEGGVETVGHVGVELDEAEPGRDGDSPQRHPLRRWARAGEGSEQRLAVGEAARHRPGVVECRAERHDPAGRHEPSGRFDRRGAAERRRDTQGARGVRAGCSGRHPCGERCCRAAARPAGRAVERGWVADLVGRPSCRELVRVQVAEQHHSGGLEPHPRIARALGHVLEEPAGSGERLPRDGVEILQPDGNAAEWRRVSLGEPRVRTIGGRKRVVLVDAHPRVDGARVAVVTVRPVALADAREARLDELPRRHLPEGEKRDRFDDAGVCRIAHGIDIHEDAPRP